MPTIYNLKLPRIILKQRAPKIDIVPDTICPKFNDLLSMFWQIFVCSAKSAKDNNKKTAYNYLISQKKSATILVCLSSTLKPWQNIIIWLDSDKMVAFFVEYSNWKKKLLFFQHPHKCAAVFVLSVL
jgi:hypothetical protein